MPARGLEVVLYALEVLEGVCRVLLCMLEAVEGDLCWRCWSVGVKATLP